MDVSKPRPAEEWMMILGFTTHPTLSGPIELAERNVSIVTSTDIRNIQLDAFRAGMRHAAGLAGPSASGHVYLIREGAIMAKRAILTAADNLKELP